MTLIRAHSPSHARLVLRAMETSVRFARKAVERLLRVMTADGQFDHVRVEASAGQKVRKKLGKDCGHCIPKSMSIEGFHAGSD